MNYPTEHGIVYTSSSFNDGRHKITYSEVTSAIETLQHTEDFAAFLNSRGKTKLDEEDIEAFARKARKALEKYRN